MKTVLSMLRDLANWHDERAKYGGAAREFHERAASACIIAAEVFERATEIKREKEAKESNLTDSV